MDMHNKIDLNQQSLFPTSNLIAHYKEIASLGQLKIGDYAYGGLPNDKAIFG
jgi:hypothetical protein